MKKTWILGMSIVSGLALTAPAQATLLFDGFSDPEEDRQEATASLGETVQSDEIAISDTDLTNAQRGLEIKNLENSGGDATIRVMNGSMNGSLSHSQDAQTFARSWTTWTFDEMDFSTPLRLVFAINQSEDATPFTFTLFNDGGTSTEVASDGGMIDEVADVGGGDPVRQSFNLFSDLDLLEGITGARLEIDGTKTSALDVSLDSVSADVPAPGALGLLGVGLLGLGLATRLRKRA
ncbi:PEP-CTERM sorting domain-containing protein [Aquisalimonas sp. 2447]|uniref:PEP-CTERM sorting domain-containing protein n=1 Tax=Aquisalimonas sp. 2447 TaxID=2740807 RepID=UPI0014324F13|nr:PEP-CTERM sorting domain-containing protein [Aquisalimonas sp. 2447]QIT56574.1 PEP-CTERM sorting domain-containing protein [Aquisalimonas sp. 2447]